MAKITKDKLIELIQESLGEYMDDSPGPMAGDMEVAVEPESPCAMAAAAEEEEMDLGSQVAELKGMMQQLMDMMGGQAMQEISSFDAQKPEKADDDDEEEGK
jgi:hypothetical protein